MRNGSHLKLIKTMKQTEILTFSKTVATSTHSTAAIVTIEHGLNKRGESFRNVNQVNTANNIIDDARDSFEEGKTSLEDIITVIESQGYEQQIEKTSETFHEGNGWNYKVKVTSAGTFIQRYHTNGHMNSVDDVRMVDFKEMPKDYFGAEDLYMTAVQSGSKRVRKSYDFL